MIYIIYDFTGLKITKKKYQQYFRTLLCTAKICEEHSNGNKRFKILPAVTGCDLCINLDKTAQVIPPHSIKSEQPMNDVNAVPDKAEFSRVLTNASAREKCIVCAMGDPHDLFILYDVKYDHVGILFSNHAVSDVVSSFIRTPVMPFESRGSHDRFTAFNPEIGWTLNNDFWSEIWLKEFHEERISNDKSDILVGALRHSMVGLFYDRLGDNEDAVKASSTIAQFKHTAIWPQLENDIRRHFGYLTSFCEGFEHSHCGYLNHQPNQFNQIEAPATSHSSSRELLRKSSPEKDPCVPPKWLTHLYADSVENDGEFPDKKKLHDLLDHMVDYVGSWAGCNDAHSAQQMKDILPLLVRCKIILEKELEYFRASKEKKE